MERLPARGSLRCSLLRTPASGQALCRLSVLLLLPRPVVQAGVGCCPPVLGAGCEVWTSRAAEDDKVFVEPGAKCIWKQEIGGVLTLSPDRFLPSFPSEICSTSQAGVSVMLLGRKREISNVPKEFLCEKCYHPTENTNSCLVTTGRPQRYSGFGPDTVTKPLSL